MQHVTQTVVQKCKYMCVYTCSWCGVFDKDTLYMYNFSPVPSGIIQQVQYGIGSLIHLLASGCMVSIKMYRQTHNAHSLTHNPPSTCSTITVSSGDRS